MKKTSHLLLSILSVFLFTEDTLAQNLQIQKEVENEFLKFKNSGDWVNGKIGVITFITSGRTHVSNQSKDIQINLNEIAQTVSGHNSAFRRLYIQYIIGHELGHNTQFGGFKPEVQKKDGGEATVFLECNADLLSGIFMTIVMQNEMNENQMKDPKFDLLKYSADANSETYNLYRTLFEMKEVNNFNKTHTTNDKRLLAFKEGILVGKCLYYSWLKYTPENAAIMSKQEFENQITLYKNFGKALGYDPYDYPNSNPFIWAHLEAIRIVNNTNPLAKNLVVYDKSIKKDYDNGKINYSFRVINKNAGAIKLTGRIYSELISATDKRDLTLNAPIDGQVYEYTIQTEESIFISGTLSMIVAQNYTTRVVLPGDRRSLYYVFDQQEPTVDRENVASFNADFSTWDDQTPANTSDLIGKIAGLRNDLFNYAAGVGVCKTKNSKDVEKEVRSYEPSFKMGSEEDQKINYYPEKKQASYTFNVYTTTSDKAIAKQRFKEIVEEIKNHVKQFTPDDLIEDEDYFKQEYSDHDDVAVNVILWKDDPKRIRFEVFGKAPL